MAKERGRVRGRGYGRIETVVGQVFMPMGVGRILAADETWGRGAATFHFGARRNETTIVRVILFVIGPSVRIKRQLGRGSNDDVRVRIGGRPRRPGTVITRRGWLTFGRLAIC